MRAPTPPSLASPCHVGGQASPTAFGGEVEEAPESGLQVRSGPLARPRPGETRVPRGKDQLEVVWGRHRDSHRTWILWTATEEHSTEPPVSWTAAHAGSSGSACPGITTPRWPTARWPWPSRCAAGRCPVSSCTRPGQRVHRARLPGSPRGAWLLPVHGQARVGPRQRPRGCRWPLGDPAPPLPCGRGSLRWDGLVVPAARQRGRAHAVTVDAGAGGTHGLLVELAHTGAGQGVDVDDGVRQLPCGE